MASRAAAAASSSSSSSSPSPSPSPSPPSLKHSPSAEMLFGEILLLKEALKRQERITAQLAAQIQALQQAEAMREREAEEREEQQRLHEQRLELRALRADYTTTSSQDSRNTSASGAANPHWYFQGQALDSNGGVDGDDHQAHSQNGEAPTQLRPLGTGVVVEGTRVSLTLDAQGLAIVVGEKPFPRGRVTRYVLTVEAMAPHSWLLCGIAPRSSLPKASQNDPTCRVFGWDSDGQVYKAGTMVANGANSNSSNSSHGGGGWTGWRQGDLAVLEFDPFTKCLSMFHRRLAQQFIISNLPASAAEEPLRLQLSLNTGTVVHLFAASYEHLVGTGFV